MYLEIHTYMKRTSPRNKSVVLSTLVNENIRLRKAGRNGLPLLPSPLLSAWAVPEELVLQQEEHDPFVLHDAETDDDVVLFGEKRLRCMYVVVDASYSVLLCNRSRTPWATGCSSTASSLPPG